MEERKVSIHVDIEELMQKLQDMLENGFVTVKLEITETEYYEDSILSVKAVDISSDSDEDYGEMGCVSESF